MEGGVPRGWVPRREFLLSLSYKIERNVRVSGPSRSVESFVKGRERSRNQRQTGWGVRGTPGLTSLGVSDGVTFGVRSK